ncbi:4'-phosphopantetheinyl transferase superfamily protein [Massilia sp. 9096]|uniref:4'-phosphopantetheinyl transferase superfamily protein n=1 Tax=Massilia sp. 9096 TaxID=1500894 RepID=UPI0012E01779|nr:4'-phosphopantetheinyl transferase superfamily protein [Massilia sp. 9096]
MPSTPPMPPAAPSAPPGLALAWWRADGAFAPGLAPVSSQGLPQVWLVGMAGQSERDAARREIRNALRAALAAILGVDPAAIDMPAAPGDAPYALIRAPAGSQAAAPRRIALAISHDEALSVAAIALQGAVGIDVMRIADIPDWEALARDYLGPEAAARLAALDAAQRPAALARAWSEREARLKCAGLGLGEWRTDEAQALSYSSCLALAVPDGYVGTLAVASAATG